jgi:hypothetical protein
MVDQVHGIGPWAHDAADCSGPLDHGSATRVLKDRKVQGF